jgi:hypothetical protein
MDFVRNREVECLARERAFPRIPSSRRPPWVPPSGPLQHSSFGVPVPIEGFANRGVTSPQGHRRTGKRS